MKRSIRFCFPRRTVPVSVTGTACDLDCAHCGRHYLTHMVPLAQAPENPRVSRASSLLVSGGCTREGVVPVAQHIPSLAALREGRRMNWHVGLVDEAAAAVIAPHADAVSFDFVTHEPTIREVYGLDVTGDAYVASYQALRARVRTVPHVTIGLRGGRLDGELSALRTLADLGADDIVFLVLIPTGGTRYAGRQPTPVSVVTDLLRAARSLLPSATLTLGCMRPGGLYRDQLDEAALEVGLDGIVNPSSSTVRLARSAGLEITESEDCCVL